MFYKGYINSGKSLFENSFLFFKKLLTYENKMFFSVYVWNMNKIYILGKYQTKTKGVKNASPGVIKCCFFLIQRSL